MSGGSSSNNSWTILTPEETATETLRPLEEVESPDHHEESDEHTTKHTDLVAEAETVDDAEPLVDAPPVEEPLVIEAISAEINGATSGDAAEPLILIPATIAEAPPPSSPDIHGDDTLSQSEGLPEGPSESSPDPDTFSDSVTHMSPSLEEPPALVLATETPKELEVTQEDPAYLLHGEELQQEEEETALSEEITDVGKQPECEIIPPESPVDSEATEEKAEQKVEDGESEVRRRRSLLAALERVGMKEEQEEAEEEFQLPQREDDSGFSLNKCILGALILLGIGTIFISENDYAAPKLKDADLPVKQEWEAPPPGEAEDGAELLDKLAKGNLQIAEMQAQVEAQNEELKVVQEEVAEGAKEQPQWAEVEEENSRLKMQMASLLLPQKENERMKKELNSLPALQKELEKLRATVAKLVLSTADEAAPVPVSPSESPPSGPSGDSAQEPAGDEVKPVEEKAPQKDWKKAKYDTGEKTDLKEKDAIEEELPRKERKDAGKKERKDAGMKERKEWKKERHQQGADGEEKTKEGKLKYKDEGKEWKHEKVRGDEGQPWKDKSEGKDWKKGKERKKIKHEDWDEGKHGRKKVKEGKDHGAWRKDEKEWKKGKHSFKESGKEWKQRGERKEWNERKSGKDHGKERKGRDEKEWGKSDSRKWAGKEERKEGKREGSKERKYRDEHRHHHHHDPLHHKHHDEPLWHDPAEQPPAHSQRQPPTERPGYWHKRREQLLRNPKPSGMCSTPQSCAQEDGLLPVSSSDFDGVLQGYLTRAEEAGVVAEKQQELVKLVAEFFRDGVFIHHKTSFRDFAEDVGDILEDMVEGDEAAEEEMDWFEREAIKTFSVPGGAKRGESGRGRG